MDIDTSLLERYFDGCGRIPCRQLTDFRVAEETLRIRLCIAGEASDLREPGAEKMTGRFI